MSQQPAAKTASPKLAVWKFTSCDGCQLSLLDCEDELLAVAGAVDIAYFMEATSRQEAGPYDLSIVEGSITTPEQLQQIQSIRAQSGLLISIGACATSGGIQALRNGANIDDYIQIVYAHPDYISTLSTSTPISDHVKVDYELHGCPINKMQLLELINTLLNRRQPNIPSHSVCVECKLKGNVCVMSAHGTPCMGPVTRAGCDALCPSYDRGCFGCYGPKENSNSASLSDWWQTELGVERIRVIEHLRTFNTAAPPFDAAARQLEDPQPNRAGNPKQP